MTARDRRDSRSRDASSGGWLAAAVGAASLGLVACARDRGLDLPVPQGGPPPSSTVADNGFNPIPLPAPSVSQTAPTPKPSASSGLPAAALPPLDPVPPPAPPASSAKPATTTPKDDKAEMAELYRAQDQCLSSCDQFACMKIAAAYKNGTNLPKDPLAGRRYAMHACQECGAAGPGIADQCPAYQLTPKSSP